jgi:glutamine phosphoribosylpyrophosphate amidotransferase
MDGLIKAVGESKEKFCFACFNGEYPVPVSDNPEFNKHLINKEKRVSSNA